MAQPLSSPAIPPAGRNVALMLSGGGARAAYQVGILRYISRAFPDFRFQILTGASAGAINASFLAAYRGTQLEAAEGLAGLWGALTFDQVFRVDSRALAGNAFRWGSRLLSGGSSMAPHIKSLLDTSPLRLLLSSVMTTVSGELIGIDENIRTGQLQAIALSTLNYGTGQTVTWIQGSDVETYNQPARRAAKARLSVEHVMASAALPMLFPAIRIGSAFYGDGGVRLLSPLSPAIHLGAERILAISTRYCQSTVEADQPVIRGYPPPAQVIGTCLNAIFLDVVEQDAITLQRINRLIERVPPDRRGALRPVELLVMQPSEDFGKIAARYHVDLPKGLGFLTRGLGSHEAKSADLLSLLLFHPEYLQHLVEVGERDGKAAHDRLAELVRPRPQGVEGAAATA